jgi:hypothetical protein
MSKLRVSPRKSLEGEHVSFGLREFERGVLGCASIFPGSSRPSHRVNASKIVDFMSTSVRAYTMRLLTETTYGFNWEVLSAGGFRFDSAFANKKL